MCWKQEHHFKKCGCRMVDESSVLKKCAAAEAYGRPCLGSFESQPENVRVRDEVCPDCKRAGVKGKRRILP